MRSSIVLSEFPYGAHRKWLLRASRPFQLNLARLTAILQVIYRDCNYHADFPQAGEEGGERGRVVENDHPNIWMAGSQNNSGYFFKAVIYLIWNAQHSH